MPHNMFCPRSPAQAECSTASAPSCVSGRGRSRARLHQRSHRHVSLIGWMWLRRPLPITWMGTNSTRYPPRTKASNISDSISKWSVSRRNARPRLQVDQPKPALRVGQEPARDRRDSPGHPAIDSAPQPGDRLRVVHAIADDQCRACLLGAAQESRDIFRPMLAVPIQGHHPVALPRERSRHTCFDCRAFARVSRSSNDLCSRLDRPRGGFVVGTVVHHQHQWQILANSPNQPANAGLLVAARDHNGACCRPVHLRIVSLPAIVRSKICLLPGMRTWCRTGRKRREAPRSRSWPFSVAPASPGSYAQG